MYFFSFLSPFLPFKQFPIFSLPNSFDEHERRWIPACAGMTLEELLA